MGPPRQGHLAAVRAPAPEPCKVRAHCGTRLVAGPRPNQMACPIRTLSVEKQGEVPLPVQGGSGGIPRPFEGGIGGPGGHRGEVGIPPAPLAGGANLQEKRHATLPRNCFFFTDKIILSKEKSFHKPQTLFIPLTPKQKAVLQNFPPPAKLCPFLPCTSAKLFSPRKSPLHPRVRPLPPARPFLFRCSPFQGAKPVVK